ncbi:hypothetical protein J6590_074792 [Homalodisca vitripennis]|nr:hypothetical protein J6590_074792 [Homalodisca vitripennis]
MLPEPYPALAGPGKDIRPGPVMPHHPSPYKCGVTVPGPLRGKLSEKTGLKTAARCLVVGGSPSGGRRPVVISLIIASALSAKVVTIRESLLQRTV